MKKGIVRENLIYFILLLAIVLQAFDYFYDGNKVEYNTLYSQGVEPSIVLTGYKDETIPTEEEILAGKSNFEIFKYYVTNQKYVMHAGGTVDGVKYTNSYEALKSNYDAGNRIFEIDLNFTSDHHVVLLHGWSEWDYKSKLGVSYNPDEEVMSYTKFKDTLLHKKYHTMSVEDLVKFIKENPYCYFILNIKGGSKTSITENSLKQLVNAAKRDASVLNRVVIWGYNLNVIETAKRIYDFELITLSYNDPSSMPSGVNTKEKMIDYCIKNHISSLIYATGSFDEEMAKMARAKGIYSFVFTVDNQKAASNLINQGATMVLSNDLKN